MGTFSGISARPHLATADRTVELSIAAAYVHRFKNCCPSMPRRILILEILFHEPVGKDAVAGTGV
jgi:hypothetical protein